MNESKRNRITRNFFRELLHVLRTERKIDVVTAVDIATKETERLKKDLTKSEAFASSFEEGWDAAQSSTDLTVDDAIKREFEAWNKARKEADELNRPGRPGTFEGIWDEAFGPIVCEHEPVDTGMIYSWCKKCNTDMALNKPKGEWEVRYPTKQPKEQESD